MDRSLLSNLDRKKVSVIIASLALIWSAQSNINQAKAQELTPTPEKDQTAFEQQLGIIDFFTNVNNPDLLDSATIEKLILQNIQNWYQKASIGEKISGDQIPDVLKQLIAQRSMFYHVGHGQDMIGTMDHILRYFQKEESDTDLNLTSTELHSFYDLDTVSIEKFEDKERGVRGIRFSIDMDDSKIINFLKTNPDIKVLNMSFQVGKVEIEIDLETLEPVTSYPAYLPNQVMMFSLEKGVGTVRVDTADGAYFAPVDKDGKLITLYSQEALDRMDKVYMPADPYRTIEFEPYSNKQNRERLYNIARVFPNVVFVTSAGNSNSFSEIEEVPNVLQVGMLYNEGDFPIITGNADFYIDEAEINGTGLPRKVLKSNEFQTDQIDSSSEAAATVSTFIELLRQQNPRWSAELTREYFLTSYVENFRVAVQRGLSETSDSADILIPLLSVDKLLKDFDIISNNGEISIDQNIVSSLEEDLSTTN